MHRDKEVGSGGEPRVPVFGETATGDDVMDRGVGLALPAPGMQAPGATREVRPAETRVFSEPFECLRRGVEQSVVREALMRADKQAQGRRDGAGEQAVRPGKLSLPVVMKPRLGFVMLALWTVAVATGMLDAVLLATALALIEAMAIMSALAILDSTHALSV